jgi:hypothetical protein
VIVNVIAQIDEMTARLREADGDKPLVNYIAKDLKRLVDDLARLSAPGAGEFKWSAKAVKGLTRPAPSRHGNPSVLVARGEGGEVWHSTGEYAKRGEVPKRFGLVDVTPLPITSMHAVIPNDRSSVVTVTGAADWPGVDAVMLDNGAVVNRLLLTYTMSGHDDVTLTQADPLHPIVVIAGGEVVGLVMPLRPMVQKK